MHVSGQPESDPAVPRVRVANIANVLTGVRLVLVPIFLLFLFAGDGHESASRITAFVIFAVAVITDRLDGSLARTYGMVTEFGKLADPIADKALTGMAFIGLSINGELWWWVTILILVREWGITLLRFLMLKYGVMAANRGGKLKTVTQAVAVILYLLPLPGWAEPVAWVVMGIAFLLTMVTGLDYCWQAWKLRRDALRAGAG